MPKKLLNKSELAPKRGFKQVLKNKTFRLPALTLVMMLLAAGISLTDADVLAFAAQDNYTVTTQSVETQATQSSRWHVDQNGTWYLTNEQGTGNVINSWFQDLDGSWYVLSPTGSMYAGLIHDNITGKDYYLQTNHDGFYGRMAVTDGAYNVNGQTVYLTFNQSHDGNYGCITSGLSELQRVGVPITNVDGLPTDTSTTPPQNANQQTPPKQEDKKDNTDLNGGWDFFDDDDYADWAEENPDAGGAPVGGADWH